MYGVWSFILKVLDWVVLEKDDLYYYDVSFNKGKICDLVVYELICEVLSVNYDILFSFGMKFIIVYMVGLVYFVNGVFFSGVNYGLMGDFIVVRDRVLIIWDFLNILGMMYVGEIVYWMCVVYVIGYIMMRIEMKIFVYVEDMRCFDLLEFNEVMVECYEMMGVVDEGFFFSFYFML